MLYNGDTLTNVSLSSAGSVAGATVGGYPIVASAAQGVGLSNYMIFYTNGTLTVLPAMLTGMADVKSRLYGAVNPPFTVSYSGFVNGQDSSVVTGTLGGSTPATTNSPVGSYPISVGGQSAPNYTIQYVNGTLTVLAAPLLVTADNTNRAYGQPNP